MDDFEQLSMFVLASVCVSGTIWVAIACAYCKHSEHSVCVSILFCSHPRSHVPLVLWFSAYFEFSAKFWTLSLGHTLHAHLHKIIASWVSVFRHWNPRAPFTHSHDCLVNAAHWVCHTLCQPLRQKWTRWISSLLSRTCKSLHYKGFSLTIYI